MSHIVYEQITNKPARLIETRGDGMAIYEMVECRSRVVCLPESMMLVPSTVKGGEKKIFEHNSLASAN